MSHFASYRWLMATIINTVMVINEFRTALLIHLLIVLSINWLIVV